MQCMKEEMAGWEPQVMPQIDSLFILYMLIAASGGHDAVHERGDGGAGASGDASESDR